jgi:hypothetical protein
MIAVSHREALKNAMASSIARRTATVSSIAAFFTVPLSANVDRNDSASEKTSARLLKASSA